MKIDKSIGTWTENSTILDNYAYQLYIHYMVKKYKSTSVGSQFYFKKAYYNYDSSCFIFEFYEKAKIIIRKEKLLKLPH